MTACLNSDLLMYKTHIMINIFYHRLKIYVSGFIIICFVNCCKKNLIAEVNEEYATTKIQSLKGSDLTDIPLELTIYNPCCQEDIYLTGIIHQVQNSHVIHMRDQDITGVGVTSGVIYNVESTSIRNYVFDPNEFLATLNWSIRMKSETGCAYNVQFVVHITRDQNGEIKANIHSGNFFCLFF